MGLWKLWSDERGEKHLECDAAMCRLMGIPEDADPREADRFLGERIYPDDREKFMEYDRRLKEEAREKLEKACMDAELRRKSGACHGPMRRRSRFLH